MLALRPWQVNPPQQFLSTQGGVSPVRRLRWQGQAGHNSYGDHEQAGGQPGDGPRS